MVATVCLSKRAHIMHELSGCTVHMNGTTFNERSRRRQTPLKKLERVVCASRSKNGTCGHSSGRPTWRSESVMFWALFFRRCDDMKLVFEEEAPEIARVANSDECLVIAEQWFLINSEFELFLEFSLSHQLAHKVLQITQNVNRNVSQNSTTAHYPKLQTPTQPSSAHLNKYLWANLFTTRHVQHTYRSGTRVRPGWRTTLSSVPKVDYGQNGAPEAITPVEWPRPGRFWRELMKVRSPIW